MTRYYDLGHYTLFPIISYKVLISSLLFAWWKVRECIGCRPFPFYPDLDPFIAVSIEIYSRIKITDKIFLARQKKYKI